MSRQITQEQTEQLFQFCKKHWVNHYDLQIELVDHLASAIEEQWEEMPELSFNDALNRCYSKFGITGFSKIKKQKEKALHKKYDRLLWKYFVGFYRWPKVISTFIFTFCLFFTLQTIRPTIVFFKAAIFLFFIGVLMLYGVAKKKLKPEIKQGKTFLLFEHFGQASTLAGFLSQIPNIVSQVFFYFRTDYYEKSWILLIISFVIVAIVILMYGYLFYIPKKIKQHFMEQFPEFAV